MLARNFIPAFSVSLFLLFSFQGQLPSGKAYACWCCAACGATYCGFCCCPGTSPDCTGCTGITDTVESISLVDKVSTDIRALWNTDESSRVMHLAKVGECARRSFALRVLGNAGGNLKIEPFSFGKETIRDSTVSLKIAASAER
jgi:hypothetical protein